MIVFPVKGRPAAHQMHMPAAAHWNGQAGEGSDSVQVFNRKVCVGYNSMGMGIAQMDSPAAYPRKTVVVQCYTGQLGAAKELMDMAKVLFRICSRHILRTPAF